MTRAITFIFFSSLFLFLLGIIMIFNISSANIIDSSLNTGIYNVLIKHLMYSFLSFFISFIILKIGYVQILKISPFLFFFLLFLLIVMNLPGIGLEINGAKRWIYIKGISFQPSEFMKYILPIYFIYKFKNFTNDMSFIQFLKNISIFFLAICLILIQPDNGMVFIICFSLIILFILMNINWKYWGIPVTILMFIGGAFAYQLPYVSKRINVYLYPEKDLYGTGHQPLQSKIATGSGGLIGKGLGNSIQKLNYLPSAKNDYIAAIYAEEFGFIGICFLIILYLILIIGGFYIAINSYDEQGFYLASILTFLIGFQAFLNLGVVSALLPSKGIALPFFSQGGSSLLINIIGMSIICNIGYYSLNKKYAK